MTAVYKYDSEKTQSLSLLTKMCSRVKKNIVRFKKSNDGVAAIEFATTGPLFLALLLAVTDLGIMFFMNRTIEASTDMISRQIKTSIISSTTDITELREKLCALPTMKIFNCDNVLIDVKTLTAFEAPQSAPRKEDGSLDSDGFTSDIGPAASINIVSVYVKWPSMHSWLAPEDWVDGKAVISATTAFLKEG